MDADLLVCLHSIETESKLFLYLGICRCNHLLIGNHELFVYMLLYYDNGLACFSFAAGNCMLIIRVCLTYMHD